jgi:LAO/AO transport system kinase
MAMFRLTTQDFFSGILAHREALERLCSTLMQHSEESAPEHQTDNRLTADSAVFAAAPASRRVLAKAISLIESSRREDEVQAQRLLDMLLPYTGASYRIGITGVPGVGKSTFIEAFGHMLVRQGYRVAVMAVDPSSARTGGSILGDKTRMNRLAREPMAFIRPSAAGGSLGGVARRTRETMLLCEAAGFDVIIVETVGVGQSETAVASMVDMFLMLLLPNAGDELQGIKRGIMELADGFVINKADTDRPAAQRAAAQVRNAVHLFQPKYADWMPQVLTASAVTGEGLEAVWQMCFAFLTGKNSTETASPEIDSAKPENGLEHQLPPSQTSSQMGLLPKALPQRLYELRRAQSVQWMEHALHEELHAMLNEQSELVVVRRALERDVLEQGKSPTAAAREIAAAFRRLLCSETEKKN